MPTILLVAFLTFGGSLVWALLRKVKPTTGATLRSSALCLIGDSLAVGLKSHFETLAKSMGIPFIFDAKVGRFTKQQSVNLIPKQSIVFVSLGTNDATSLSNENHIRILAKNLLSKRVRAVIWLLPPTTKDLPGLAGIRSTIQALSGVIVVQTLAALRSDDLHPESYDSVFQDIFPILAQMQ
jgi:hypothetical protein